MKRGISGFLAVAAVLSLVLLSACGSSDAEVSVQDGNVMIPLAMVEDGQAKYFSLPVAGRDVDFFVLKSSDGVVRAAFDACDVCFEARKGYTQDGEFMVCDNCGQRFHSSRINEVRGGCNPAPLERRVEGDMLVIDAGHLAQGVRYF